MNNAFSQSVPEIYQVMGIPKVRDYIRLTLESVLSGLGADPAIAGSIGTIASCQVSKPEYERKANRLLSDADVTPERISGKLGDRASIIASQVSPYVMGKVLDLGCGDGKVGEILSAGHDLTLADIYRHAHIDQAGLPFELIGEKDALPYKDNEFDTVLLLTVLHHSNYPLHTIEEAARVVRPGGKVLAIESVYGIDRDVVHVPASPVSAELGMRFQGLAHEEQRLVNIFFDHFYNRVIHYSDDHNTKVPVPFNFQTPGNWQRFFADYGLQQKEVVHLGIDQPLVPEYHTLHVLEANK